MILRLNYEGDFYYSPAPLPPVSYCQPTLFFLSASAHRRRLVETFFSENEGNGVQHEVEAR